MGERADKEGYIRVSMSEESAKYACEPENIELADLSFSESESGNERGAEKKRKSLQPLPLNPPDDDEDIAESPVRSGLTGASANFINSIVGAGIIGLPYAIKRCGFISGCILLVFVALASKYTVNLLISTGVKHNCLSYESVAQRAFGETGYYLCSFFMFVMAFGAMCAYFIIIGKFSPYRYGVFHAVSVWRYLGWGWGWSDDTFICA